MHHRRPHSAATQANAASEGRFQDFVIGWPPLGRDPQHQNARHFVHRNIEFVHNSIERRDAALGVEQLADRFAGMD
ncbi:MAG TPA: hypothetical protein VK597_08755, partial [Inquilinus sp.]|nr:hypothetical protein [Inquilinus sp.]